jgi:hypothetical protein
LFFLEAEKFEGRFSPTVAGSRSLPGTQQRSLPVKNDWNLARSKERLAAGAAVALFLLLATTSRWTAVARADGPLAAKVKVTTLQSYKGSSPLPKPDKILVYDLILDTDIQVDKSQRLRPRHLIAGDENPDAIAKRSESTFSEELTKQLAKTGIPVQHVAADTAPSDSSLMVQGRFISLREGDKTQRVTVGMSLGSAQVQTKIDVRLKTSAEAVLVSQFQTETTTAKNVGAVVPVAAGLNPGAVATKSVLTDRRKTLHRYVSKTADTSAKEIMKLMADQGWIKLNGKGEVVP